MKKAKKDRLEAAGWKVESAADFLHLGSTIREQSSKVMSRRASFIRATSLMFWRIQNQGSDRLELIDIEIK